MNHSLVGQEGVGYIEKELGLSVEKLSSFPRYFLLETVCGCNAKCIMCGIDFSKKKKQLIDFDLFAKIIAEIASFRDQVEKVMLYLDGEPLLDRFLPARIRQAKEAGIRKINIASNASLLTNRKAEELLAAGLDEIYITLDSLNPQTYEGIRRGLSFAKVYGNIRNFIALRNRLSSPLVIRVQMVLQEKNAHEGEGFIAHWSEFLHDQDQVVVVKAHNWASHVEVMRFGDEQQANAIPCIALWGTLAVHVDGRVGLCCMDSTGEVLLGDLTRETISSIWNGPILAGIRQKHLHGQRHLIPLCNGCTLWRESKKDAKRVVGASKAEAR